ncbi:MAG: diguanylate cyclase [Cyanobacteria bacterium SIG32]|nr:diguanylate cyclase [Cyanobacteria bacterium SIG32]
MEKSKVENKKPTMKKSLGTNPISGKGQDPFAEIKAANKKTEQNVVENVSNPLLDKTNRIVAKINDFNTHRTNNRLYAGGLTSPVSTTNKVVDYSELLQDLHNSFQKTNGVQELFSSIHKIFTERMDCNFTAFGLFHEKSKCINLKLYSKRGDTYSSKIFMSDETNPVIEAFKNSMAVSHDDIKFLSIPYIQNSSAFILPMMSINQCIGVMILGKESFDLNVTLLEFFTNHLAMYLHNAELYTKTNKYANTDTLTSLYNHRGFQEVLSSEIQKAEENKTSLSIVMLDVNNISKINRELGHAKGDEIIKLLAEKVKQNIRPSDCAGRYGGDEICIIMPNTNTSEAKYLAEYITYCLSCCFVDDVGPVKVSVGISTYPECTKDQEKLLILAEQAMYISQAKGYKEGMSAIISSSDFNFWDDVALHSFAEILTKRHAQIGINFEEELLNKFHNEQIISHNHLMEMATSLAGAIDAKDPYTKDHSTSVSRYSEALARAANLPEEDVQRIALGALLHDVGKIGIPESVLKKPDKLSDDEWEIMKQHPTIGAEKVLEPNEALRDLIPIVKYHHERVDGKGYPEQLKGKDIPLAARIVSVADAYHALVSDRPYRKGMPIEKACEILRMGSGIQWDADLVRLFISIAPSLTTSV